MSFLRYLGKWSALIPESRAKSWGRVCAYSLMSRVRNGSRTLVYRGVKFRMGYYPLMGGTGFDSVAMDGYLLHRDIMSGDTVIDAGPYVGDFTIYAAIRAGPTGTVIAFEPDATSLRMLATNIRLNGLQNIHVVKKALWKDDAVMSLTGTAFASELSQDNTQHVSTAKTVSLDNELQRMGVNRVDFVKMDIEGAEVEALQGMTRILDTHPCIAVASYHAYKPGGVTTSGQVEEILRGAGYRVVTEYPNHLTTYGDFGASHLQSPGEPRI